MNSVHGDSLTPLLKAQGATLHLDAAGSFAMDEAFPPPPPTQSSLGPIAMAPQVICRRCLHPGVDVKLQECGCFFHTRCTPVSESHNLGECPACRSPVRSLYLMPMNFDEIDAARETAASTALSSKRGKKRKNATLARLNPSINNASTDDIGEDVDLRTGRWTAEETLYCDKLIEQFEAGSLPISDGIKLNDFLADMLKSKQSRLTKKMKNARLSARAYKYTNGYIANFEAAREFSAIEIAFFDSIPCALERAEIRFHMQKEWRELFSSFCIAIGQKLNADAWLSSVEEMDRRISRAKDAARMARRKVMMGYALSQDSLNQERGVFIDSSVSTGANAHDAVSDRMSPKTQAKKRPGTSASAFRHVSSPFVGKVIQYIDRNHLPFEHIDAWVPSFISNGDNPTSAPSAEQNRCRLCFAGFATTRFKVPIDGGRPEPMSSQDQFDLLSFGEYSAKFSFDVGCGLPGRVYSSGICSWEQGVANAPSHQFERVGGAAQWGIKTVLGIPIPSPNVGRIVVLLYSRHDRARNPDLVRRTTEELTKLMPTPKWKLVVDIGMAPPKEDSHGNPTDSRVEEVLKLVTENSPIGTHQSVPYSSYLPGFEALRQLLVKQDKSDDESDMLRTTLDSYTSYISSGRKREEIAWMIARDFMLLSQPKHHSAPVSSATPLLMGGVGTSSAASGLLGTSHAASQSHLYLGSVAGSMGLGMASGQSNAAASLLLGGQQTSSSLYSVQPYAFRSLAHSNPQPTQQNK